MLFGNLGKDEFKALEYIDLEGNELTDKGLATLVEVIDSDALPLLANVDRVSNHASDAARQSVGDAVRRAVARRLTESKSE